MPPCLKAMSSSGCVDAHRHGKPRRRAVGLGGDDQQVTTRLQTIRDANQPVRQATGVARHDVPPWRYFG
jgi:hypothetical protein